MKNPHKSAVYDPTLRSQYMLLYNSINFRATDSRVLNFRIGVILRSWFVYRTLVLNPIIEIEYYWYVLMFANDIILDVSFENKKWKLDEVPTCTYGLILPVWYDRYLWN